jgi:hypothetical protein
MRSARQGRRRASGDEFLTFFGDADAGMRQARNMTVASASAWTMVVAAMVLSGAAQAAAGDLRPVADTEVDAARPDRAGGSSRVLHVSRTPRRRALLRFDLNGLDGAVAGAVLQLYVTSRGGGRVAVRRLLGAPAWSERLTTYRRRPRAARGVVRSARRGARGWLSIDVTRLVAAGRRVDLAVDGAPRAAFASREHGRPPRLTVTLRAPVFTPGPVAAPRPTGPSPPPAVVTVTQELAPDRPVAFTYAGSADVTLTGTAQARIELPPGAVTLTQREVVGWPLIDLSCTGGQGVRADRMARTVELTVAIGDEVRCRFANGQHDPVVAAAGDIACQSSSCAQRATSELLLDRPELARVLPLGDVQYESGLLAEFLAPGAYDDTWGRLRPITAPVPGNHEYTTAGAAGYFDYFNGTGNATGRAGDRSAGYYSFDLGPWHLVALNSNVPMSAGSAQEQWLRRDLAAHPAACTLAYMHAPRWTSGAVHGPATGTGPLWQALHAAGADAVLAAHNHQYERFAPQDPAGVPDWRRGIRQFVVGTGGAGLYDFAAPRPNSEVRERAHGVLELTLRPGRYDWRFVTVSGRPADRGSARCHGAAPSYTHRGLFSREEDGSFDRIASLGFNLIDSVPGTVADVQPGLEAMVWVGNFDDETCTFEMSDSELSTHVAALAGDPRVGVWFISDEPSPNCPDVYAQHADRTALIKAIDPEAEVLIVIDGNSGAETLEQIPHWSGIADHIGINPYTCWQGQECRLDWIDHVAEAADASGLDYWGVVQAFGEPTGAGSTMCALSGCGKPRLPTEDELHRQFYRWRASRMTGYLVFEWRWPDGAPALWLANQPDLQAAVASENASAVTP